MIQDITIIKIQNKKVMQKEGIMQLHHRLQLKARFNFSKRKKNKI
jgi:hypothetical protein